MAGRKIGYVQATLMVAGFILTMSYLLVAIGGMFSLLMNANMSEAQMEADRHRYAWAGLSGLVLCLIAWFWSLASSIDMVRTAQKEPPILK